MANAKREVKLMILGQAWGIVLENQIVDTVSAKASDCRSKLIARLNRMNATVVNSDSFVFELP